MELWRRDRRNREQGTVSIDEVHVKDRLQAVYFVVRALLGSASARKGVVGRLDSPISSKTT